MDKINRVLIIDDVALWSKMLRDLLRVRQIDNTVIYTASTPKEGIEKYRELVSAGQRPDLVLLDYRFDLRSNGVVAGKEILNMDKRANIYVFTYYETPEVIKNMAAVGVTKFISKLTDTDVLIEELTNLCQRIKK